jgi:hypothetical protein
MHYVTRRSHLMQKHMFSVTCSLALSMETNGGPPEHEKLCVDVSFHGRTGMHYMTRRSHLMQKHKFGITCCVALFVESVPVPHEHEK